MCSRPVSCIEIEENRENSGFVVYFELVARHLSKILAGPLELGGQKDNGCHPQIFADMLTLFQLGWRV